MADKKATHVVIKSGLYYTPSDGEMEVGTQMVLTDKQAEKLTKRGFIKSLKEARVVDGAPKAPKAPKAPDATKAGPPPPVNQVK